MRALYGTVAIALALAGLTFMAGSASATVLCDVEPNAGHECLEDHVYGAGADFTSTLKSSTLMLKSGFTTVECTGAELASELTSGGGEGSNVGLTFGKASFSGCNCPTEAQSIPWKESSIAWTSGTNNGTLSVPGLRIKATCSGVSCEYGNLSGAKLEGGESGVIHFENTLAKVSGSFLCSSSATLQGQSYYKSVFPDKVYVGKNPRSVWLCSDNPCTKTHAIPAELKAQLSAPTVFEFKYDKTTIKPSCTGSEIKVPFNKAASPLVGTSSAFGFTNCVSGSYAIAPETPNYRFELEPSGGGGGNLTMRATESSNHPIIKITNPGVFTCEYQIKEVKFTLAGGNPAKLAVSQTMTNLTGGKCEGDLLWTANYEVTQPKPLYVF